MHARNEHTSQVLTFVEVPVGLEIMPQNNPTVYEELKIWHVRCYLNLHVNWPVSFFPLVKERESRSSLDLSVTIFINLGCSIRHPGIPLENCLKHLTHRRRKKPKYIHVVTHTFHAIKTLKKKCLEQVVIEPWFNFF